MIQRRIGQLFHLGVIERDLLCQVELLNRWLNDPLTNHKVIVKPVLLQVLRLDERTRWSWFIVFIPMWIYDSILILYLVFHIVTHCKNGQERSLRSMRRKIWFVVETAPSNPRTLRNPERRIASQNC